MTKEEREIRIENLVYRLNNVAEQRKMLLDSLWVLEDSCEQMRIELLGLLLGKPLKDNQ